MEGNVPRDFFPLPEYSIGILCHNMTQKHINEAFCLPTYISKNGDAWELRWAVELRATVRHSLLHRSCACDGGGVLWEEPGVIPGWANEVLVFSTGSSFIFRDEALI